MQTAGHQHHSADRQAKRCQQRRKSDLQLCLVFLPFGLINLLRGVQLQLHQCADHLLHGIYRRVQRSSSKCTNRIYILVDNLLTQLQGGLIHALHQRLEVVNQLPLLCERSTSGVCAPLPPDDVKGIVNGVQGLLPREQSIAVFVRRIYDVHGIHVADRLDLPQGYYAVCVQRLHLSTALNRYLVAISHG